MKKWKILIAAVLPAFLLPLSGSLYMPNLGSIEDELVAISWIIPSILTGTLLSQGFFQFIYGPISYRSGRKKIYLPALTVYIIGNILCYFSWNGKVLAIFMSIQAAGVACVGYRSSGHK